MSSSLGPGRDLDDAPGVIGVTRDAGGELPPLPDDVQACVLHDQEAMERLLLDLSVNVTAMLRDPLFYVALRSVRSFATTGKR